jgi:CMP-N-acetylneuraminic acid synthetase/spore coat polysaccharide biosynthesis predicted glycosyltransferase SpsG
MKGALRVIAVVPARGGYDEVPYLNIKKLGAMPLIAHTLRHAADSRYIDRVVVSTDDDEVAEVAREYGADVPFRRPAELSGQIPSLKPVIAHAVEFLENNEGEKCDVVVMLQATSPFRTARQIDEALDKLVEGDFDSVISLSEEKALTWRIVDGKLVHLFGKEGLRENMEPLYREDGAVRVMRRGVLDAPEALGRRIGYITLDRESSITVRDIYDFWMAEKLVRLPRILFRVDGGTLIGMGQVYRSLAIADEIRSISSAADIQFLMRAGQPGGAEGIQRVSRAAYSVRVLSDEAPASALKEIREYAPNIIVNDLPLPIGGDYLEALANVEASTVNVPGDIEDLEARAEMASVIVATLHAGRMELEDFSGGPTFAILRESFEGRTKKPRERGARVVVGLGRNDPQGLTLKVLRALDGLHGLRVDVVVGSAFSYPSELEEVARGLRLRPNILKNVPNMAEVLFDADLVLCSGNQTVFEIAVLGTPGVVLCQNALQRRRMETFARRGSVVNLGLGTKAEETIIQETVRDLLENLEKRVRMSEAGRSLWEK